MVTRDRLVPWGLGLTVSVTSLCSATGAIGVRSELPGWLIVLMAAAAGVAAALVRVRWWPILLAAAVGWLGAGLWPAAFVASYQIGSRLRRRLHLGGYLAGSLAVVATEIPVPRSVGGLRDGTTATPVDAVVMWFWLVILPLVVGLWLGTRRDLLAGLRERAVQLEHEQQVHSERARADERTRIAREMHDVVAHQVSLMVVHAGALEVSATEPDTVETAALIRETGRDALADLRNVLGVLRSPQPEAFPLRPPQTLADLPELLRRSRAAGVVVHHHELGTAYGLPTAVDRAAYRVVQEALTNVHKHAGMTTAEVTVCFSTDALDVSIYNGPPVGPAQPVPGAGLGLVGLRERVELLDGELATGHEPDGGFTVRARFPAAAP